MRTGEHARDMEAIIERRDGGRNTPVLIVTGFTAAEGIPKTFARLSKPFRHADLPASLADLMLA